MPKSKLFLFSCILFILGITVASFAPERIVNNSFIWFSAMVLSVALAVLLHIFKNSGGEFFRRCLGTAAKYPICAIFLNFGKFFEIPRPRDFKKFSQNSEKWHQKRIRQQFCFGIFFTFFFFLGLWRGSLSLSSNSPENLRHYHGKTVIMHGAVADEPDIRQDHIKLEIMAKLLKPRENSAFFKISGKTLVAVELYPIYNYGDELEIKCKLREPENFSDFAYSRYLATRGIGSVCYYPEVKLIAEIKPDDFPKSFYTRVFKFKNKLRAIFNQGLSEAESGLARALMLGDKNSVSAAIKNDFSLAGMSHIISISGLHISVIALLVMSFLIEIGFYRKRAFYCACVFLLLYIIMIGMQASAIRAGVMGFLALGALSIGRLNKMMNSLALAAALMLLFNPDLLRGDIGFQLSFLAVLGIVLFNQPVNDALLKIINRSAAFIKSLFENFATKATFQISSKKIFNPCANEGHILLGGHFLKSIAAAFTITIAAQIFTLPVIAVDFHQISLIAPLANLLVLWTMPILFAACLIALVLSWAFPAANFIFFLPVKIILRYIIFIAGASAQVPFSHIQIAFIPWYWLVVYYGFIFYYLYRKKF